MQGLYQSITKLNLFGEKQQQHQTSLNEKEVGCSIHSIKALKVCDPKKQQYKLHL